MIRSLLKLSGLCIHVLASFHCLLPPPVYFIRTISLRNGI